MQMYAGNGGLIMQSLHPEPQTMQMVQGKTWNELIVQKLFCCFDWVPQSCETYYFNFLSNCSITNGVGLRIVVSTFEHQLELPAGTSINYYKKFTAKETWVFDGTIGCHDWFAQLLLDWHRFYKAIASKSDLVGTRPELSLRKYLPVIDFSWTYYIVIGSTSQLKV